MFYRYHEAAGAHGSSTPDSNHHSLPGIPCTGCGKCRGCPMELDIPGIFASLNAYFASGNEAALSHILTLPGELQPKGCVGCGACMERCPEHIDISGFMLKAAQLLRELEKQDNLSILR